MHDAELDGVELGAPPGALPLAPHGPECVGELDWEAVEARCARRWTGAQRLELTVWR